MSSQAKDSEVRNLFIELARQWQELALQKEDLEKLALSCRRIQSSPLQVNFDAQSVIWPPLPAANASASAGGTTRCTRRADKMTEYPGF